MSKKVLGVNEELRPVMVVDGLLPHHDGHDSVCVRDKLPGSPDSSTAKPGPGLVLDVGLADVPGDLGAGTPSVNTWAAEIRHLDERLHHGLQVGARLVRAVQAFGAGCGIAALRSRTDVAVASTAVRMALDYLDMLVGMGGVEINTPRLVGVLLSGWAVSRSCLLLGVLRDSEHFIETFTEWRAGTDWRRFMLSAPDQNYQK